MKLCDLTHKNIKIISRDGSCGLPTWLCYHLRHVSGMQSHDRP